MRWLSIVGERRERGEGKIWELGNREEGWREDTGRVRGGD